MSFFALIILFSSFRVLTYYRESSMILKSKVEKMHFSLPITSIFTVYKNKRAEKDK